MASHYRRFRSHTTRKARRMAAVPRHGMAVAGEISIIEGENVSLLFPAES